MVRVATLWAYIIQGLLWLNDMSRPMRRQLVQELKQSIIDSFLHGVVKYPLTVISRLSFWPKVKRERYKKFNVDYFHHILRRVAMVLITIYFSLLLILYVLFMSPLELFTLPLLSFFRQTLLSFFRSQRLTVCAMRTMAKLAWHDGSEMKATERGCLYSGRKDMIERKTAANDVRSLEKLPMKFS